MNNLSDRTLKLVQLSMFTAIIILLAFVPVLGYIPLGVINATTIHIPVIIGAIILGPKSGAFLGFVFGVTSLIKNSMAPNLTSFVFTPFVDIAGSSSSPVKSLIICFVPRILIGVVAYYVFALMRKLTKKSEKNLVTSIAVAGVLGSMTNTLLVMNGIYLLFGAEYAAAREVSFEALYGIILGIIGTNGVPEAIVAAIITVAVCRIFFKSSILRNESARMNKNAT